MMEFMQNHSLGLDGHGHALRAVMFVSQLKKNNGNMFV